MPHPGDVLPRTPAGARAAWVLDCVTAVAEGKAPPSAAEIADAFTPRWLAEVPVGPWLVTTDPEPTAAVVRRFVRDRVG